MVRLVPTSADLDLDSDSDSDTSSMVSGSKSPSTGIVRVFQVKDSESEESSCYAVYK